MLDIGKYESIAMLDLSADEREILAHRAETIAAGFGALDDVDVAGAEPLVSVLDIRNVMREDIAEKFVSRDIILESAPSADRDEGYFRVPETL